MRKEVAEKMEQLNDAIGELISPLDNLDEALTNMINSLEAIENKTEKEAEILEYLKEEYTRITCSGGLEDMYSYLCLTLE